MNKALNEARPELGEYAPRIETIHIPVDKIREVIGSGGSVIREIVAKSGAKIDISDDGTVKIASANAESIRAAIYRIKGIASEPEVGEIYQGKVVKVMEFGAFVNFFGAKDGLVHISQLAEGAPKAVTDVVKEGDMVWVKLLGFDDRGKVRLSMKVVDQTTGKRAAKGRGELDRGPQRNCESMAGLVPALFVSALLLFAAPADDEILAVGLLPFVGLVACGLEAAHHIFAVAPGTGFSEHCVGVARRQIRTTS